jgi:isoquinoline 1-oxidoreductase beta subunit
MRRAGAAARQMLIGAAAQAWGVDPATCRAELGQVLHPASGRRVGYGAVAEAAARLPVPTEVALKPPERFRVIGKQRHRLDGAGKVNGSALFGIDARPPGLRVAAIANCPVVGGRLRRVDEAPARAVRGVRQVVKTDTAVAVVADHYGAAKKGLAALQIEWDEGPNAGYSTAAMVADLAQASRQAGAVARRQGDVAAAAQGAAQRFEAVYQQPFLAHACMEPMNCTVHVRRDACDLWLGTQVPTRAQAAAAAVTGLPIERIQVHNHLLGGGFGRRLDVDFVTVAVQVARQVDGPVKVVWSREEDTQHSTLRPHHYNRLSAALDGSGKPVAWSHRVTGSSILARWAPQRFQNGLDGDAIRDAAGPYAFEHLLIDYVRREPASGITTGFWRGVGHMQNAFPVECFLDELAHAAGADPIAYRKALLRQHPRAVGVLDRVARRSGWGRALPPGQGMGVALTFSFGSYAAQVTQVAVDAQGELRVERMVIVADCGRLIAPDTVVAQMQGGAVFGLSAVLWGNISIRNGRVEQGNFDSYRILRCNEMPPIDIELVDSTDEPGGVGELSTVVVAPSLLNAVFAATGRRVRELPFGAEDIRRA